VTHCFNDRQNLASKLLIKVGKLITEVAKQVVGIIEAFCVTVEAETGSETFAAVKDHRHTVSHA